MCARVLKQDFGLRSNRQRRREETLYGWCDGTTQAERVPRGFEERSLLEFEAGLLLWLNLVDLVEEANEIESLITTKREKDL